MFTPPNGRVRWKELLHLASNLFLLSPRSKLQWAAHIYSCHGRCPTPALFELCSPPPPPVYNGRTPSFQKRSGLGNRGCPTGLERAFFSRSKHSSAALRPLLTFLTSTAQRVGHGGGGGPVEPARFLLGRLRAQWVGRKRSGGGAVVGGVGVAKPATVCSGVHFWLENARPPLTVF